MLETSARLLRLLALLQARRYWSGAELAERLEVTARTLRRDVTRLRDLGYTVDSSSGTAGGYQLGRGSALPPLLLEDDEAMAVGLSLRTACASAVTGMEAAGLTALAKFEHVLPARLRRRLNTLQSSVSPLVGWHATVDARTISMIAAACHDHEGLRFNYTSHDGAEGPRRVEPHQLVYTNTRWYLVAWDVAREDWRSFRVDRIKTPVLTDSRFEPREPPEGGYAAYISTSVSYRPYPHRARVILHTNRETAAERLPPNAGVVTPLTESTCMLSTGAHSLDALCVYLAMIGEDFQVIEPIELLHHLRIMKKRFARAVTLSTKATGTVAQRLR